MWDVLISISGGKPTTRRFSPACLEDAAHPAAAEIISCRNGLLHLPGARTLLLFLITDCPKSADIGGGNPAGQGQDGTPSGTDFMRHCLAAARAVGEKDQQHRRGQGEAGPRDQTA